MTNFVKIMKVLAGILPTFLLCLRLRKVNLERKQRARQFPMPIIGVVSVIFIMIFVRKIRTTIYNLIMYIPRLIASVAGLVGLGSVGRGIAAGILSFFNSIDWEVWLAFIVNAAVLLVYIEIKRIALGIINRTVKNDSEVLSALGGVIYNFDSERQSWFLKVEYVDVRRFFKTAFYSVIGIASVLMYITKPLVEEGTLSDLFYPAYLAILVGEFYFYLDGFTKREYLIDLFGEKDVSVGVANYSLMRTFLRNLFGENLMEEGTSVNSDINSITNNEILSKYDESNDQMITSFTTFYKHKVSKGMNLDQNYFQSSLELLQGKSILFNDPFYYDLMPYIFYPMNRKLLAGKKVLVVLGRHSIEENIVKWVMDGVKSVTNLPYMWNVGILGNQYFDGEIGVLGRANIANMEVLKNNQDFFNNVEFVIIIEPNKLITTAQVGLNMTIRKCREKDPNKHITFCMCDKNCDGLVDSMSHILLESIAEVSATNKHKGTVSHMTWDTNDKHFHHKIIPNISRYLGIGTELSFVALKNQIKKTKWFGGEAYPVVDQKWIAKQYYHELAKYAELPSNQGLVDEMFETSAAFWDAPIEKNSYLTVEDESYNLYEILREFSTRSISQGFVNVISSEYLLKDYMAGNSKIFETDAKAIPTIVADYAKTKRNVTLGLLLRLSNEDVLEEDIVQEFSLIGIPAFNIRKQLWYEVYKFFAGIEAINKLPAVYKEAVEEASKQKIVLKMVEFDFEKLISERREYSFEKGKEEIFYCLTEVSKIRKELINNINSAVYIAEDEYDKENYLGSELVSQVYQKHLPGQYLVLAGKNYQLKGLTANNEIILRRAADHIDDRYFYRQIRDYEITSLGSSDDALDNQNVSGVIIRKEFADINVKTPGYFRMTKYNDMKNAKLVSFDKEGAEIPVRSYKNKQLLRICFTDLGENAEGINYTLALLINEVFRSLFADNQAYISAVTSFDRTNSKDPLTFTISSSDEKFDKNSIYIIEDSQLDLGLIEAVERNIDRIMKIVCDYICWHKLALEESKHPTKKEEEEIDFGERPKEKEGFFKRIVRKVKEFFAKLFGKKKPETEEGQTEEPKKEKKSIFSFFKDLFKKKEPVISPEPGKDEPTNKPIAEEEPIAVPNIEDEFIEEPKGGFFEDDPVEEEIEEEIPDSNGNEEEISEPTVDDEEIEVPSLDEQEGSEDDSIEIPESVDLKMEPETIAMIAGLEEEPEPETIVPEDDAEELEEVPEVEPEEEPIVPEDVPEIEPVTPEDNPEEPTEGGTEFVVEEDDATKKGPNVGTNQRKPYHERYYTLYGYDAQPENIMLDALYGVLVEHGFDNSSLRQAREGKTLAELIREGYVPNKKDAIYCDFCGSEITGVEYEKLGDGRDRCMQCSRTAIKTEQEFKELYEEVKRNMESFFTIKLETDIRVEMVNSKKLHKKSGKSFVPTGKFDPRTLGFARRDKNGFSIVVENGSPRMMTMLTLAHEMTHIWQFCNWDAKKIKKKYGSLELEVYEGMAKWVEIQYAYLINEPVTAMKEEIQTLARDDEYGRGFIRYKANYPITEETVLFGLTPFINKETPLQDEFLGEIK